MSCSQFGSPFFPGPCPPRIEIAHHMLRPFGNAGGVPPRLQGEGTPLLHLSKHWAVTFPTQRCDLPGLMSSSATRGHLLALF